MLNNCYIISWFGNNDIRDFRLSIHKKQVEWLLELGFNIKIFAQQYKPEEYIIDERISYIKNDDKVLSVADSRNIILKEFYNSEEDYGLFLDNDCILYDKHKKTNIGDGKLFRKHINENFSKYNDIDCFLPIDPMKEPYGFKYVESPDLYNNNHVFSRNCHLQGAVVGLRNLKKIYNKELYYSESFGYNEEGIHLGGSDLDFGLNLICNGFGVYQLENIVLKEYGNGKSTWAVSNEYRNEVKLKQLTLYHERWADYGYNFNPKNLRVNRKDFMDKSFLKPYRVIIPFETNNSPLQW